MTVRLWKEPYEAKFRIVEEYIRVVTDPTHEDDHLLPGLVAVMEKLVEGSLDDEKTFERILAWYGKTKHILWTNRNRPHLRAVN